MRTLVRAAALLVLAGCKGEAVEARPDVGADEKLGELYEKAHRDAMLHTGQLALKVFSLEDPVGAAALGVAPLAPAPVSSGATAPLREAHRAAWAEAREVDGEVLTPTDRTLLLAMRFGLDRVNDRLTAAQPARTDPTWYAQEVRRYLGALAAAVAFGPCPDCRAGLDALAGEIEAAVAALGAASKAALDAASEDWIAVDKQLGALRERAADPQDVAPEAIERARAAVAEARRVLGEQREDLPTAGGVLWGAAVPPAQGKILAVLPARVGSRTFGRRLAVEERLTRNPGEQFQALGPALARLAAMERALGEPVPAGAATAVTPERCQAAAGPLLAFAAGHALLRSAKAVDCEGLVRLAGQAPRTDDDLTLFVIDHGLIMPTRIARRAAESEALALLGGRIAERSQLLTQSIAIAAGMKHHGASRLALRRAREAGCTAAAALWVHGELGPDSGLASRLEKACEFRLPSEWIAAAEARPRAALEGSGLWVVGSAPADMGALDQYWWAPMGLVLDLAMPEAATGPVRPPPKFNVETLDAKTLLEEGAAEETP